jgi:hypothetical protein
MFDTPKTRPYLIGLIILLFLTSAIFDARYFAPNAFNKFLKIFQAQKTEETSKPPAAVVSHEEELQNQVAQIVDTKDSSKCNEIQDQTYQTVCRNNIALNDAQEKKDASYCQKVDNRLISIADCERDVVPRKALDQKDIKVCDEATIPEVRESCQADFWSNLAQAENNIKECDNLAAGAERDECLDVYFLKNEFMTGKSLDCNKFASQQAKKDCGAYKEIFNNRDIQACSNLKTDFFIALCYSI